MTRRRIVSRVAALAVVMSLVSGGRVGAASVYLPRLAFRVLATPHFRIYYHQGGEAQARRLALIAESVRAELQARSRLPPPPLTHVVLANQDDDPNGSATPLPYPTVRLGAVWPATSDLIANTDDWLRMVFIHEYAHIVQLERTRGWARVARAILGRSPISFPNLFLPQWQIEGYATLWESRLTGLGRLNGGDSAAIVRSRARAGALPLDQANGGLVEWPGGNIPYLEGAWFLDRLATRFGEEALGSLNDATAGRLPYLSAPAFTRVFGRSLGELWREFQDELPSGAGSAAATTLSPAVTRLTEEGYWASSPRFDPTGRRLTYFLRDPHGFPAIREVALDAEGRRGVPPPASRRVVDRSGGRVLSVNGGHVYFDEIDWRDNVAVRSDLWVADASTGRRRRLTRDARLLEPDVSPDGSQLACVRVEDDGTRSLAVYDVTRDDGRGHGLSQAALPIRREPGETYGAPRWSPDGRQIVAERRREGGRSEVVVIEMGDGATRIVAAAVRGRVMTPDWMPGGSDVVYASDATAEFQIYSVALATAGRRQLTSVPGGATFPDVSPDGRTLAFVGAGPRGFDVYTLALDAEGVHDIQVEPLIPQPPPAGVAGPDVPITSQAYSPFPTVLPRSWTPLADTEGGDLRLGFGLAGADVLARHEWAFSALWRVSGGNGSGVPPARPDWSASYAYDRWRPSFFVAASDSTSLLQLTGPAGQPPLPAALREQDAAAGVALPIRRVRHAQVLQAAFNAGVDTVSSGPAFDRSRRPAFRSAWAITTGKEYGWSISTEDGVAAAVTSEQVRAAFGGDGDADAFTGELRAYWRPGRGHAVIAARAGYGTASGDESVRRRFYLGGSIPAGPLIDFGSDAFRMLRGFDDSVASGSRTAVASLEWRQPLLRVERGWGTVPVLVRSLHGAFFVDAGHAWDRDFRIADVRTALGAEASLDIVAGFALRLTITGGVAWTHDPAATHRSGGAAYVRLGPSF